MLHRTVLGLPGRVVLLANTRYRTAMVAERQPLGESRSDEGELQLPIPRRLNFFGEGSQVERLLGNKLGAIVKVETNSNAPRNF